MRKITIFKMGFMLLLCGILAISCGKGSSGGDDPDPQPNPNPDPNPNPNPDPNPQTNEYVITFDANGATGSIDALKFTEQATIPDASELSYENHVFVGWNTDKNATTSKYDAGSKYTAKENVTLYAIWTEVFKIIYHYDPNEPDTKKESTFTAIDFAKGEVTIHYDVTLADNQTLTWKDADGTVYKDGDKVAKAAGIELWAVITNGGDNPGGETTTQTLTFDANGATGTIDALTFTTETTIPTADALTYNKHKFVGWSANKNSTTAEYYPNDKYTGQTATLYAIWTEVYTVTYNFNGKKETAEFTAIEFAKGDIKIQCSLNPSANEILVWKDGNGNSYENGAKVPKAADLELTADISTKVSGGATTEEWQYKDYFNNN